MSKEPFERLLEAMRLSALTKVVMDLLILEHELNFGQVIGVLSDATAKAIASSNVSEEELNEFLQGLFERLKKMTLGYMSEVKNIKEEKKNEVWAEIREKLQNPIRLDKLNEWIRRRPPVYAETYNKMRSRGETVEERSAEKKRGRIVRLATDEERQKPCNGDFFER